MTMYWLPQRSNTTLLLVLIGQFFFHSSFAQDTILTISQPNPILELSGYSQTIYYSAGFEERAISIAELMEDADHFFLKEIHFIPKTKLYILAPEHWKEVAVKPLWEVYGFPHNIDQERLAIAAQDNDFWRSFLPPLDQLSPAIATQVAEAYGQQDGTYSMMPFFDLLALHEMGHSYTSQAGLRMHRHWMSELFVNIMLHTYVAEKAPARLPALEAFPNMVISEGTSAYTFTSLEDFERLYPTLGMGAKNYGWYQCRLHAASKDIYLAGGKKVIKKLWNALVKHQEDMTDEAFVAMLKKEVHPSVANVYLAWDQF